MRQKLLLLLLTAMTAIGVQAQTKMIIHQKSGGDIEVYLNDKPVVTYEDTQLIVTTPGATTLQFELSRLEKVTFEKTATSIEFASILTLNADPSRIYDLNGRLVKTVPAGEAVQTSQLPQGMYIIKNNNHNYKINKK